MKEIKKKREKILTKKSFAVILIISVVVTYIATFVEVLLSGNVVAGKSGFPFRFGSSSLFGGSTINYTMFSVDVVFWFIVIWGLWKLIQRPRKK